MARRRSAIRASQEMFFDDRVETWATAQDVAEVEAAGTDPARLAPTDDHLALRLSTLPEAERPGYMLKLIAALRRQRAITDWATAQGIPTWEAIDYFVGDPVVRPS